MIPVSQMREKYFPELTCQEQVILGDHTLKLSQKERELILEPSTARYIALPENGALREKMRELKQKIALLTQKAFARLDELQKNIHTKQIQLATQKELLEVMDSDQKKKGEFWISLGTSIGAGLGGLVGYISYYRSFAVKSDTDTSRRKEKTMFLVFCGAAVGYGISNHRYQLYAEPLLQPLVTAVQSTETEIENEIVALHRLEGAQKEVTEASEKEEAKKFDNEIRDSRDYRVWALEAYKIAIPILTQFLKTADERETYERNCECPISHDWMVYPVLASDGNYYEKEAIENYIQSRRQQGGEIVSPFRSRILDPKFLKYVPKYYHILLTGLKIKYNARVEEQHVRYVENKLEEDRETPASIFYNDPERRATIVKSMMSKVRALDIPIEECLAVFEDLKDCKELPSSVPLDSMDDLFDEAVQPDLCYQAIQAQ